MTPEGRSGAGGIEGRRVPRTPVDLEVVIGGRTARSGRVADLSLGGCLVRTEAAFADGAVLDVTLALPDGPLRVKGRVAQVSRDGEAPPGAKSFVAGIEFLTLAAADEGRLRAFLEAESERRRVARTPPA
jgi:hypothetical protein